MSEVCGGGSQTDRADAEEASGAKNLRFVEVIGAEGPALPGAALHLDLNPPGQIRAHAVDTIERHGVASLDRVPLRAYRWLCSHVDSREEFVRGRRSAPCDGVGLRASGATRCPGTLGTGGRLAA